MKKTLTTLSMLALASALALPGFAKTKVSKQTPKAQETTSTTAKVHKNRKHRKHSTKAAAKTNTGATTAVPSNK